MILLVSLHFKSLLSPNWGWTKCCFFSPFRKVTPLIVLSNAFAAICWTSCGASTFIIITEGIKLNKRLTQMTCWKASSSPETRDYYGICFLRYVYLFYSQETKTRNLCIYKPVDDVNTQIQQLQLHSTATYLSFLLKLLHYLLLIPVVPVGTAGSSTERWHFKAALWHCSCVYALVPLFPIICLMLPSSFLYLCPSRAPPLTDCCY